MKLPFAKWKQHKTNHAKKLLPAVSSLAMIRLSTLPRNKNSYISEGCCDLIGAGTPMTQHHCENAAHDASINAEEGATRVKAELKLSR